MSESDNNVKRTISRRRLLETVGVGAAAGLAGCGGGSGNSNSNGNSSGNSNGNSNSNSSGNSNSNGNNANNSGGSSGGDLGERVPTIAMEYWSNQGGITTVMENGAPTLQKNLQQRLGLNIKVKPVEFTTQINNTVEDKRTFNLGFWYHTNTPDRLDPQEMTRRYSADWAGGNGRANPANYVSCDYTDSAVAQETAPSEKKRRQDVYDAHGTMSKNLGTLPLTPNLLFGAARTDLITLKGVGKGGIALTNPYPFILSEPKKGNTFTANINAVTGQTQNYPTLDDSAALAIWNHLINSPLIEYGPNLKLQNVLADSVDITNKGKKITVKLVDATFHNGDPITAADVAFTFQQLHDQPGAYPHASPPPFTKNGVKVVDNKTVEFNFKQPYLAMKTKNFAQWGILNKKQWVNAGAKDNPEGVSFDGPLIGSGPFKMTDFQSGQHMATKAHSGNPHNPDHDLFLQVYRSEQTALQAFKNGDLALVGQLSPGSIKQIKQTMSGTAKTAVVKGFMPFVIYPQWDWAPTKFREFRAAVGAAMDRKTFNDVALQGNSEPQLYSDVLMPSHPYRPPNDTLTQMTSNPSGSESEAKKHLTDAGWGFDGSGNLHYPKGKDLTPRWPKGQTPPAGDFPCLNKKDEYVPSNQ